MAHPALTNLAICNEAADCRFVLPDDEMDENLSDEIRRRSRCGLVIKYQKQKNTNCARDNVDLVTKGFYNETLRLHIKTNEELKAAIKRYNYSCDKVVELEGIIYKLNEDVKHLNRLLTKMHENCDTCDLEYLTEAEIHVFTNFEDMIKSKEDEIKHTQLELAYHEKVVAEHYKKQQKIADFCAEKFGDAMDCHVSYLKQEHPDALELSKVDMGVISPDDYEFECLARQYYNIIPTGKKYFN